MGILNKQNFVKVKITKYEGISFAIIFIMIKLIYVKITLVCESERSFTKRVLFFLYKKFCVSGVVRAWRLMPLRYKKIEKTIINHNT